MRTMLLGAAALLGLTLTSPAQAGDFGFSIRYGDRGYHNHRSGHYHYHPGQYDYHRGHYHYRPGHHDYHRGREYYHLDGRYPGRSYHDRDYHDRGHYHRYR